MVKARTSNGAFGPQSATLDPGLGRLGKGAKFDESDCCFEVESFEEEADFFGFSDTFCSEGEEEDGDGAEEDGCFDEEGTGSDGYQI